MAGSVTFYNAALDGAIPQVTGLYSYISVGLYSGDVQVSGNSYSQLQISGYNAAGSAQKAAAHRVNFSPASTGNSWSYDNVRLYGQTGTLFLHSTSGFALQTILPGDTHQILVTFTSGL